VLYVRTERDVFLNVQVTFRACSGIFVNVHRLTYRWLLVVQLERYLFDSLVETVFLKGRMQPVKGMTYLERHDYRTIVIIYCYIHTG